MTQSNDNLLGPARQPSPLESILLASGCHLYPQKGKVRVPNQKPLFLDKNGQFVSTGRGWDSSGVDTSTLPPDCVILDIDNISVLDPLINFFQARNNALNLLVLRTQRGFHLYGRFPRVINRRRAKFLRCGLPCEVFCQKRGRLTVYSAGRELVYPSEVPPGFSLADLAELPSWLEPVHTSKPPEVIWANQEPYGFT